MPRFLDTVFGRKKPTSSSATAELAKLKAALAAAPNRIAAAEAALKRVADLSDDEHAASENELAAAKRSMSRLEAQVAELRVVLADTEKAEAAALLRARADAAREKMKGMGEALDRYDAAAVQVADAAQAIKDIDVEVDAVNREVQAAQRAGLDAPQPVPTSTELFRSESDEVTPDKTVVDEVWEVSGADGRWQSAGIFVERNGEMIPEDPSARKRKVQRVIPGRTRPGRRMMSPLAGLVLPASRLTGQTHWPKGT